MPHNTHRTQGLRRPALLAVIVVTAILTFAAAALLTSVFTRKQETRASYVRVVEVTEQTDDPAVWAQNWPRQYDSYKRTVDSERTRYGGSDAIPKQKLDADPWLKMMWAGYAFSIDHREARGHAYMLVDQEHTERVLQRPQPGACLHCHASNLNLYRHLGQGDIMAGFEKACAMTYSEARGQKDDAGNALVEHPAGCVDCHDPATMGLRVTRPGFIRGIAALAKSQDPLKHLPSIEQWRKDKPGRDYDPNRDASRQEMRSFVCGQCHVEYYFAKPGNLVTYPWANGLKNESEEAHYDKIGFSDWFHGVTGGGMLKAQHPEFEMWNQGIHARSGVACADCHMPYQRQGATKISDHHVRSPLLNIARSCQTCHNIPEAELLDRAIRIQDTTRALLDRSSQSLTAMIQAIAAAKAQGADSTQLGQAIALQRKAQWRLDWVYSENSVGFHAPQEAARLLAESIDYARQAQLLATQLIAPAPAVPPLNPQVHGATPADQTPPRP
ncbi:MAG: ammonia-forming cytochrome c nitrite reductase subunit c552 [Phycisphaeraceae bacterium]